MNKPLIISLSSIPPRFDSVYQTLESLLSQDVKIDLIELNISKRYRRFPNYSGGLPKIPAGVRVRIVEEEWGPATKILPGILEYALENVEILYCDDDRICPPNWARSFLRTREYRPEDAIASSGWHVSGLGIIYGNKQMQPRAIRMKSLFDLKYRMNRFSQSIRSFHNKQIEPKPPRHRQYWKSGYVDIAEGCGGVMITPKMFDPTVFKIPDRLWSVDDIWLSGMLAYNGIGIWADKYGVCPQEPQYASAPLWQAVIDGFDRQQANQACAQYLQKNYAVWSD